MPRARHPRNPIGTKPPLHSHEVAPGLLPFVSCLLLFASLPPITAAAKPVDVDCPLVAAGSVKVDGFFNDWRSAKGVRGEAGADLVWEVRAARDAGSLYLVFGARDDHFVPSSKPGRGDRIILTCRGRAMEILPGDLEDQPPKVARGCRGASVDGATRPGGGWILELGLPWSCIPAAALRPDGLTCALAVYDSDPGGGGAEASTLLDLVFPENRANRANLFADLGLPDGTRPRFEILADVGGDPRVEQVLVVDHAIAIVGDGLGKGAYYYATLPFEEGCDPIRLEAVDLAPERGAEIALWYRVTSTLHGERHQQTFLSIYGFHDDALDLLFTAEIVHRGPGGQLVENSVALDPLPKGGRIRIRFSRSENVDVHGYRDPDGAFDNWYQEIILPWSRERERVYGYVGGRFVEL